MDFDTSRAFRSASFGSVSFAGLALLLVVGWLLNPTSTQAADDGLAGVEMDALRAALRAQPEFAQAWFRIDAGDAAGARLDIKALLRDDRRNPDLLHLLGIAARATSRRCESGLVLRRSLRIRPDGWVALELVELLLDRRRVAAARSVIARLPDSLQLDPRVRRASAYVLVASGETEAALAELKRLEEEAPEADVAYQLAVLYGDMGQADAAADALIRAVQRAPERGGYHRLLFEQLHGLQRWEDLIEASARAGAAEAGGGLDAYYRGVAMQSLGRGDEAVSAFTAVGAHGAPDPIALAGSAAYLLQLGALKPAEQAVRKALDGPSGDAHLHHLLAMVLTRQDRESEALAHYRRAADGSGADADYRFDLMLSLCSLQRSEELAVAVERAVKDFPEDARFAQLSEGCPGKSR